MTLEKNLRDAKKKRKREEKQALKKQKKKEELAQTNAVPVTESPESDEAADE